MKKFDNILGGNGQTFIPHGREEFGERVLFEMYKDHPFDSARDIKSFMYRKYGVKVSYNLICAITNYQIKKYGCAVRSGNDVVSIFKHKTRSLSKIIHDRDKQRQEHSTMRVIRNAEKRLKNDKIND